MKKQLFARIFAFVLVLGMVMSLCMTAFAKYATIPFGEKSDSVRAMQSALRKKGYYKGSVDGNYGAATRKAVYRYQKSLGIKADGKAGNRTLTALYDGGSSAINEVIGRKATAVTAKDPGSIYYGMNGNRVRKLQRALKAAGYFNGTTDGTFGELTEQAVRKFQKAKGMHVDGIAGKKTVARLNKAQNKVKIGSSFLLDNGSRGETVKSAQRKLKALGYAPDPSVGDVTYGIYGAATASMVKSWQKATGRSQTGTLSEKEYNSLILSK